MAPLPLSLNAAEQINQKLMNAAKAHHCAGFDCATCSWRTDDVEEAANIIEAQINLPQILDVLQQLDGLRTEVDQALEAKTGHPLAHFHANGGRDRLHAITVKITLFNRIRAALGSLNHDASEDKSVRETGAAAVCSPAS